mmetsp:Transcript_56762/g.65036  ORF Transcript_56762/g.65036 Transcript_56762/m.65036 type:complete len:167 (-) Transcript_56762:106-606(-)|eukprot:CAMPEP_0176414496 /NCGR_PEP_ID=MMETSP0127-20121128/5287_1 /TAXON_ID=938130 /ORGANISM="Platyophrya macrostoma, Strain WH" /LENGTH=166 /DNA_ID=CAMNT_0017794395 /DNA_START=30 /DNA_END=530 /DNA_ORIENTATION=+
MEYFTFALQNERSQADFVSAFMKEVTCQPTQVSLDINDYQECQVDKQYISSYKDELLSDLITSEPNDQSKALNARFTQMQSEVDELEIQLANLKKMLEMNSFSQPKGSGAIKAKIVRITEKKIASYQGPRTRLYQEDNQNKIQRASRKIRKARVSSSPSESSDYEN